MKTLGQWTTRFPFLRVSVFDAAQREQLFESVAKNLPVRRVGEAHDVAQAYLFLMQEAFSTGQTVVVDSGTVLV